MRVRKGRRRRAKALWVRELDRREIHALAGNLHRQRWAKGLTERQEWLWDQIMIELAWRRSHAMTLHTICTCWWCSSDRYDPHDMGGAEYEASQDEPDAEA